MRRIGVLFTAKDFEFNIALTVSLLRSRSVNFEGKICVSRVPKQRTRGQFLQAKSRVPYTSVFAQVNRFYVKFTN